MQFHLFCLWPFQYEWHQVRGKGKCIIAFPLLNLCVCATYLKKFFTLTWNVDEVFEWKMHEWISNSINPVITRYYISKNLIKISKIDDSISVFILILKMETLRAILADCANFTENFINLKRVWYTYRKIKILLPINFYTWPYTCR